MLIWPNTAIPVGPHFLPDLDPLPSLLKETQSGELALPVAQQRPLPRCRRRGAQKQLL